MCHGNRKSTYVMLGVAGLALTFAFDISPAYLLILAVCPLMMFFMMRSMGGMDRGEDHTGHGCEHDPSRHDHPSEPRS
ncbi:MAG TPA: DUF2933 domain-containing protein [Acidimicrobiales bacterium]|nr:DUF2933 domain-containing protein [Acidimicrobiales bacterium]